MILIIDDIPDIVDEMVHLLELLDVRAIGARSIAAGIELLVEHTDIRLLICDLRLPGENGADLGIRITGHPALQDRYFDTIFMSGDTERAAAVAVDPGQVVMSKPVDPSALIAMIDCYLNGDPALRAAAE